MKQGRPLRFTAFKSFVYVPFTDTSGVGPDRPLFLHQTRPPPVVLMVPAPELVGGCHS
jgi:hypothetical protein